MKKLTNWVKNLSLSQQLFVLIFVFITFFASFFFVYLTGKMEEFIADQMYNVIDLNQSIIGNLYNNGVSEAEIIEYQNDDPMMIHIYYTKYGNFSTQSETLNENKALTKNIANNLKKQIEHQQSLGHYSYNDGKVTFYYAVNVLGSDFAVVSMATNEYRMTYRESLLNSVVNVTVIVVGGFFIVLMIWMSYLIHPLNQIRNYIEKIKIGEDAELKVNRNDEIGELADALLSMQAEVKKQEKTKEEMIHNISHDLKTPIATIKSYGESIKDGIYPYDTLEKSVDVIINNAERLEHKVHSLLYLNRIDYLVSTSSSEETTLMNDVIEKVLLNAKVIKPNIEIETDLDDDIVFSGSEEPWRLTIENLLENALRYANSHIKIVLRENEFSIANDGPCMSEDRIASLFKPFEKGQGGQFGLGLSIVHKVTCANGYQISGDNTQEGVIFRIVKKAQSPHRKMKKSNTR